MTAPVSRLLALSSTEVIRRDEEPVSKTGAGRCPLWVRVPRLPLVPDEDQGQRTTCVGWALVSPRGCNPHAEKLWRFDSVPAHSTRLVLLTVQDAGLSIRRCGFESRTSCSQHGQVVEWQTRDAQNVVPIGRGSSNLPLVTEEFRVTSFELRETANLIDGTRLSTLDTQLSTDCRCGRCPAGFHKASPPGSIPGPATGGVRRFVPAAAAKDVNSETHRG